jgi:chloramphenicol-sensitive protein RarD
MGGGILLTANWFFFIYVMNHVSIKAASFAYLVCPILTTVLASVFLKERLTATQWFAVALSAISCIILSFDSLIDTLYSVIVALSYALYLVTQPKKPELDKFIVLTVQVVFSALILLPFYPFYHGPVPDQQYFYVYISVMAIFFTILPLWLNLYALKGLKSSTVGILLYINPLMNFIIAVIYFNERITFMQALAYFIILLSIIIFNSHRLLQRSAGAELQNET